MIDDIVDCGNYPLSKLGSAAYQKCVAQARASLTTEGSCVLAGFVHPACQALLHRQCAETSAWAYREAVTVNVYNRPLPAATAEDHPGHIEWQRGNAFVARDLIPETTLIQQLYVDPHFQRFIADCFDLPQIFPLADPFAGLCVNVIDPGNSHPWHFDTNEFTVSLLTQPPERGGSFDYFPNIRSAEQENLDRVNAVIRDGDLSGVRQLNLRCGDLQLFKGRYALHRVATVEGARPRHTVIFAYDRQPGVIGRAERTLQLFGRVAECHNQAKASEVRSDALLD